LSKERLARDAAQIFRLLRAFRCIKDRKTRQHVVEAVEVMAKDGAANLTLGDITK
jgi:hypothetical protein